MKFCSFASGSAGNCYYIQSQSCAILIDAGISARRVRDSLKRIGVPLSNIYGILVTHDHYDHSYALGILGEKYHVPVYSTKQVFYGINQSIKGSLKLYSCCRYLEKEVPLTIGDINITPFHLDHDATDCVGYYIQTGDSSLAIATDLGFINPKAEYYLLKADNIVIEANYSQKMLIEGNYPQYLKQRILSDSGHLANHVTAEFLAKNVSRGWKNVYFCHLSRNNNTPEQVMEEMHAAFREQGVKPAEMPNMFTLPRLETSEMFEL